MPMRLSLRTLLRVLIIAALVQLGCAGPGESAAQLMRPCVHTYRSGIVVVAAARSSDAQAGALPTLTLSDFKVEDRPLAVADLQQLHHAVATPQGLVCTVPCSFGSEEGRWQFTAAAPGHAPRSVSVVARYAVFVGGCPSYNDQGAEVRVTLAPVAAR
jgi:hypothetical protein